jgi:two-component system chemotaxis response regulator CheY
MHKFLVVDDSPTMRKMVMSALRPLQAAFVEASNGLEAIEQLTLNPFDLVTLDLNMPDMHGLEFIKFVRSHAAYQGIPILVLTTKDDLDTRQALLDAGANLFLTKPFAPLTLLESAKKLLQK